MRNTIKLSLSALAICYAGAAWAQQPPGDPGQQQRHDNMLQTVPGKNGKEEPSSHLATTGADPNAVFVDGKANAPVVQLNAKPADFLPTDTKLYDMPADVAADIPWVRDLKYVRLPGKIALVRAPNMVVVGEIAAKWPITFPP